MSKNKRKRERAERRAIPYAELVSGKHDDALRAAAEELSEDPIARAHRMEADPSKPWPDTIEFRGPLVDQLTEEHEVAELIRTNAGGKDRWTMKDLVRIPLPRGPFNERTEA